eukprot:277936-Pleurochrysis_carterae.AAC.1
MLRAHVRGGGEGPHACAHAGPHTARTARARAHSGRGREWLHNRARVSMRVCLRVCACMCAAA